MRFLGRRNELDQLNLLLKKKSASLVVIRGRRRIGKSRLIQEFAKDKNNLIFSGLPPVQGITKQRQLDTFADQMAQNLKMPKLHVSGWSNLFWHLGNQVKEQKIVIVFDEVSWMGSSDPDFLGHLKNAWDLYFSQNPNLILILCGSVSSWIERNILSNTGFLGRVSIDMIVGELPLVECQEFWGGWQNKISSYEKFKILSVTGGVPKYLEEIIPQEHAEENIRRLCFQSNGILFREYNQIFSDLFSKRSYTYSNIVSVLSQGSLDLDEVCQSLKIKKGGFVSTYLHDLVCAGFVSEDNTWNLKNKKTSSLKKFRLKDNYLRFYLKYIQPNKEKIEKQLFESRSLSSLPGWEMIMGFQFENLVLNNLKEVLSRLKLEKQDIVMAGPFFQRSTKRQKGCQIDLLIQTTHRSLYLCEIKFVAEEIKAKFID
ncbi:MAG TPA: ATP-binding protein, partial [Waddliaceae bacterium]